VRVTARGYLLAIAILLTPFSLLALITREPGGILDTTSDFATTIFLVIALLGPACAAAWLWSLNRAKGRTISILIFGFIALATGLQGLSLFAGTLGPKFPAADQWIAGGKGFEISGTYVQMAYGPRCFMCAGGELWLLQSRKLLPGLVMDQTIGPTLDKPEAFYPSGPRSVTLVTNAGPRSIAIKPYIFFDSLSLTSSGLHLSNCDSLHPWTPLLQTLATRLFCAPVRQPR
jgi:hypothetical protein